ncbi:MAG: ABC transporter permease, partial [Fibrobacteria bacterium]|nr:ABC transporter permease [Fibrobacteria bacterium]
GNMATSAVKVDLPVELSAAWISKNYKGLKKTLVKLNMQLNCSGLEKLNSLSIAMLSELHLFAEKQGHQLTLVSLPETLKLQLQKSRNLSGLVFSTLEKEGVFFRAGEGTVTLISSIRDVLHLLTEAFYWSTIGLFQKKTIRAGSTTAQMISLGSSSLPIVLLLSFLIGLTLAIQSAIQLEKFGASLYIASGIGISMITEIGPMMTAVILAGRSGSSITAEISTMVVQEELRALQTMAINPIHFLLLPRFWALTITLPLLTICADLIGIFAGFLVAFLYAEVPAELFLGELMNAITVTMIWQSMIKAMTFAWIITLVATYKGFSARGGADAVGKATTSCVVTCLFTIILADAVFSFVFYF